MTTVGEVCSRPIVSAQVSDRLVDAVRLMLAEGVGALAVYEGDRFAGILTKGDVLRTVGDGLSPRVTEVAACMSQDPALAHGAETADAALARMLALGVSHLPVLEGGVVVGMLSIHDVRQPRRALSPRWSRGWPSEAPPDVDES